MYCVYKIINDVNDKVYVGRTTRNIHSRWLEHIKSANSGDMRHIYCAMRKYGVEHFSIQLIETCDTLDEMIRKEAYWCKQLNAYFNGYNMTEAGEQNPMEAKKTKDHHDAVMRDQEIRNKISSSMKKIRLESDKTTLIHKGKIGKRVAENELPKYFSLGYSLGSNAKGKIRIYNPNTKKESTIWEENLDEYIKLGWIRGSKPNRMTAELKLKLAQSHKNSRSSTDEFKKEQSERLKLYYQNNPNRKTKSKHSVKIYNTNTKEEKIFDSCISLCIESGLSKSLAQAGVVKRWIDAGRITNKKSKYFNWEIKYDN